MLLGWLGWLGFGFCWDSSLSCGFGIPSGGPQQVLEVSSDVLYYLWVLIFPRSLWWPLQEILTLLEINVSEYEADPAGRR